MALKSSLDKLKVLAGSNESKWLENSKLRGQNSATDDTLFKIRLLIAQTLRTKGISQKELATSLSVTPQWINKVLRGKENLSIDTIVKIGTALGVPLISVGNSPEAVYVMNVPNGVLVGIKGRKIDDVEDTKVNVTNDLTIYVKANENSGDVDLMIEDIAICEN